MSEKKFGLVILEDWMSRPPWVSGVRCKNVVTVPLWWWQMREEADNSCCQELFSPPVFHFLAIQLVPCTPYLSVPSHSLSFCASSIFAPSYFLSLSNSHLFAPLSVHPLSLSVCFSKGKAQPFLSTSLTVLLNGWVDVAIKVSKIITLWAITRGSSLHPASTRHDNMTLTSTQVCLKGQRRWT